MKSYVLNLDRSFDRKKRVIEMFNDYNYSNYEFITAVDGLCLTDYEIKNLYNENSAKKICRKLLPGEIGCALSHIKIQKKILENNSPYRELILEDDLYLLEDFLKIKDEEILDEGFCDVYLFGNNNSNTDNGIVKKTFKYDVVNRSKNFFNEDILCYLKGNIYKKINDICFYALEERSYTIDFANGTHAYSPSKIACEKLIKYNTPVKMPADMMWNTTTDFKLYMPKKDIITFTKDYTTINNRQNNLEYSRWFKERVERTDFNI